MPSWHLHGASARCPAFSDFSAPLNFLFVEEHSWAAPRRRMRWQRSGAEIKFLFGIRKIEMKSLDAAKFLGQNSGARAPAGKALA